MSGRPGRAPADWKAQGVPASKRDRSMRCASGLHVWMDAEDRGRCCDGWRQVVVIGKPGPEVEGYRVRFPDHHGDRDVGWGWVEVDVSHIEVKKRTLHTLNIGKVRLSPPREPKRKSPPKKKAKG